MPGKKGYGSPKKSKGYGSKGKNRGNGGSSYPTAGNSKEKYMSYAPKKYDSPKV